MVRLCLRAFLPFCALLVLCEMVSLSAVKAQTPANSRPGAFEAAKAAFEALPEAERKSLQDALIWTGDYKGTADGGFGRQTFEAIAAFQQRQSQAATGILAPQARSTLLSTAQQARTASGFVILDDTVTGARIGVPTKLLTKQETLKTGTRWQSADGKVTLDTRIAPPGATLQSIYERNLAIQTPGRVLTYKVLRPDFFVITGETPTGQFYLRYDSGADGLRGFSVGYDKSLAPQVDRIVVAIANSFTPFPASAAPVAQNSAPGAPASVQPQPKPQGRRLIGTGLVTGARQVVTTAPVASCKDAAAGGIKPRQITGQDVFVLDFAEDLKAKPAPLAPASVAEGAPLLIPAFAEAEGTIGLTLASGTAASSGGVSAPLQPGASGAPVFDANHHGLVGLVGPVSTDGRKIAGVMTSATHRMAPVPNVVKSATGSGAMPAQKTGAAALVATIKDSLLPITCEP